MKCGLRAIGWNCLLNALRRPENFRAAGFAEKTVDKLSFGGYNIQALARVLEW